MKMPGVAAPSGISSPAIANLIIASIVVTALFFGRELLVPLSLAVLLSFVLAPVVIRLTRWRVPQVVAVIIAVLVAFSIIFALGGLMVTQATKLAGELPTYQQTLRDKIQSVRGLTAGSGTLEKASKVLKDLDSELQNPGASLQSNVGGLRDKPIPVEVKQPDPGAFTTFVSIINPLIEPTTTTGVVLVFVIFILLQRQDLRNRFIKLVGAQDISRTTAALDEAGERLSGLFLTQVIFNAAFGLIIGIGLHFIGVPSAPLWGLIAMIMRFVPYIGALISAVFPLILAAAVGAGWSMVIMTAGLFAALELVAGQILEPLIYGHRSGLSPLAIIISASFWTWLWGPVGLVLATPLTICLVVIGRHVDRLRFLDVLLGDQPALTPAQVFYQRMLAGDPVESAEQANVYLKDHALGAYYDDVVLPGLKLAALDNERSRLDADILERMSRTVRELVEDFEDHEDVAVAGTDEPVSGLAGIGGESRPSTPAIPEAFSAPRAILCLPAANSLDEAGGVVMAQMLRRRGCGAVAEAADALSVARFFALDLTAVQAIVIVCISDTTPARLQYATRRIARKNASIPLVICLLGDKNGERSEAELRVPNAVIASGDIDANMDAVFATVARLAAKAA